MLNIRIYCPATKNAAPAVPTSMRAQAVVIPQSIADGVTRGCMRTGALALRRTGHFIYPASPSTRLEELAK